MAAESSTAFREAKLPPSPIAISSDQEVQIAFSGNAIVVNRFYLSMISTGVRLAFTEQHGTVVPPQFRAAVLMSIEDAFALRDLLTNQLSKVQFIEVPPQEELADVTKSE